MSKQPIPNHPGWWYDRKYDEWIHVHRLCGSLYAKHSTKVGAPEWKVSNYPQEPDRWVGPVFVD